MNSVFNKKRLVICALLVMLFGLNVFGVIDVEGYGYEGEGDDTSGYSTSCNGFVNGFIKKCGSPLGSSGGGASWHIYDLKKLSNSGDDRLNNAPYVSSSGKVYQILDEPVITAEQIKVGCSPDLYDWVVVYGWEGNKAKGNYNILTGPAKRSGPIVNAQYNDYDALTYNMVNRIYGDGTLANYHNRRITEGAAKLLYYKMNGTYNIASSTGYFCMKTVGFEGRARVIEGSSLQDAENVEDSGWTQALNSESDSVDFSKAKDVNLKVECPNGDCPAATILFDLRRLNGGNVKTDYTIFKDNSEHSRLEAENGYGERAADGSWRTTVTKDGSSMNINILDPSDPGEYVLLDKGDNGAKTVERIYLTGLQPNKTTCYYMRFGVNSDNNKHGLLKACVQTVSTTTSKDFKGRARATEGNYINGDGNEDVEKRTTNFVDTNATTSLLDLECNVKPEGDSCNVRFSLDLVRMNKANNKSSYTIHRYMNGKETSVPNREDPSGSLIPRYISDTSSASVYIVTESMRPGDVICYSMEFRTSIENKKKDATVMTCAGASGSAGTSLDVEVENSDLETGYVDEVYAKPGDNLVYRTTYNSLVQDAVDTTPGRIRINGTNEVINNDLSITKDLFNGKIGSLGLADWNNGFVVNRQNFSGMLSNEMHQVVKDGLVVGESSKKVIPNNFKVFSDNVGKVLTVRADINPVDEKGDVLDENVWTVPTRINFDFEGSGKESYGVGEIFVENISDSASAIIPYNFKNDICVLKQQGNECANKDGGKVFAGANMSIGYRVSVLPKKNELTTNNFDEKYATIVRNAKVRAIVYVPNDEGGSIDSGYDEWAGDAGELCSSYGAFSDSSYCRVAGEGNGNGDGLEFNKDSVKNGTNEDKGIIQNVSIPDVAAGTKVCAAVAVWPANSGEDWNIDASGSETWRISESECFIVAKKPSFQVWGGSIYSAGDINLKDSLAEKKTLAGVGEGNYVFGSWAELSLVANGTAKELSSGAGLGYASTFDAKRASSGNGVGELGGGIDKTFCEINTLSFANDECNNKSVGFGKSTSKSGVSKDRLVNGFNDKNSNEYALKEFNSSISVGTGDTDADVGVIKGYAHEDGNEGQTTKIIKVNGTVTIKEDITYADGQYNNLEKIPKIIIYAEEDINIACGVKRVDAVLIAEKSINDCSDSENVDGVGNSIQLRINGSLIADKLILNRTYGAATGVNSIIPAEIINYDTSLLLWANQQADITTSGKLTESVINELAPRY